MNSYTLKGQMYQRNDGCWNTHHDSSSLGECFVTVTDENIYGNRGSSNLLDGLLQTGKFPRRTVSSVKLCEFKLLCLLCSHFSCHNISQGPLGKLTVTSFLSFLTPFYPPVFRGWPGQGDNVLLLFQFQVHLMVFICPSCPYYVHSLWPARFIILLCFSKMSLSKLELNDICVTVCM